MLIIIGAADLIITRNEAV